MEKALENKQFELDENQINELIKLVNLRKSDIFYDFGCGTGKVVIGVANTQVKKSIGIEITKEYYNMTLSRLYEGIKNKKINNYDKIDFWYSGFQNDDIDFSDATVIFHSLDELDDTKQDLQRFQLWNKVKIIKKDIPLIGYDSIANRNDNDCWLFLSKPPYRPLRKKDWIKSISNNFDTIDDVYEYYYNLLVKRFEKLRRKDRKDKYYPKKMARKDAEGSLLHLKLTINDRYFYN